MAKTILIVDDARSMRGLVGMTLKGAGYNIIEACDGEDALNKIGQHPVNMVIADLNMPNMNGIDLIKSLKVNPKYRFLPIVMLTTEGAMEMKQQGQLAGAKAWIVKPFKPDTVLKVVKKIIG
jgi:two-component system chemotaxis response regulator CheY